jgi:hypothetical protein
MKKTVNSQKKHLQAKQNAIHSSNADRKFKRHNFTRT